ncbi:MAG: hypothetical protein HQM09_20740 [Candidatus Riflebacteria bacterium]|nr:hypothetical protein [Candidatus Riflebacteria bacterium]
MISQRKFSYFLLAVVLMAAGDCTWFSTACEAVEPGHYRGTAYSIERSAYGDPVRRPGGIAELGLFPDGHFRFAASDQKDIWTRGSWRAEADDSSSGNAKVETIEFSCEDVHGSLAGRVTEGGIEMIYHPEPFVSKRFFLERRDATAASGYGWPRQIAVSVSPGATLSGIYTGSLRPSNTKARAGDSMMMLLPDGSLSGAALVPPSWDERGNLVIAPFSGTWSIAKGIETCVDGSVNWSWGSPKPAAGWSIPSLRVHLEDHGTRMDGTLSLDGIPCDATSLIRVGDTALSRKGVSESADAAMETLSDGANTFSGTANSGDTAFALTHILGQNTHPQTGDPTRLFPLRINETGDRLFVRAPDDERVWLPFPLSRDRMGRPVVNSDGSAGHLVRLGDGSLAAFVVRSVAANCSGATFPSGKFGDDLVLSLDIFLEPLSRSSPIGRRTDRLVFVARRVEGDS